MARTHLYTAILLDAIDKPFAAAQLNDRRLRTRATIDRAQRDLDDDDAEERLPLISPQAETP